MKKLNATKTDTGYFLEYEGEEYSINKNKNKWDLFCGDIYLANFAQVKQAKDFIVERINPEDAEVISTPDNLLWECLPPAACMTLLLAEIGRRPNKIELTTLDCYGFLDENGEPDLEQANRLIKNYKM